MNINKLTSILNAFQQLDAEITNVKRVLSTGPASYYIKKMQGYYEGCMNASKFKVNETVKLAKLPDPYPSGWGGCEHFLKIGAIATVKAVDYDNGYYNYELMFDNESFISSFTKEIIPIKNKHTFLFRQHYLESCNEVPDDVDFNDNPEFSHWSYDEV